jgi:nucleotide-binding universal stress UspA family protein
MDSPTFRCILVPIDGSPASEAAVGLALQLAAGGGSVIFAHVINRAAVIAQCTTPYEIGDPTVALGPLEDDENDLFTRELRLAGLKGIPASVLSLDGVSYEEIARAARERQVDAIVMGTRGPDSLARRFIGSTAEGVLRRSGVPTIVVRDGSGSDPARLRSVLAAVDESETARDAAHLAVDLAAHDGGSVMFVHVARLPAEQAALAAVEAAQKYALERGVPHDAVIVHGSAAAEAIRISAEMCHADAIVVGTHGRRGFERLLLGSIAEAVIRESTVPIVVVPSAAVDHMLSRPVSAARLPSP